MKAIIKLGCCVFILPIMISCKKETSFEGCSDNNKPPISVAGPDKVITLPAESVLLDGRRSSDQDGMISGGL